MALKRAFFLFSPVGERLTAESVQGATLAFQSVDDVHGGDGLALGVLGVSDSVTDDVFQEDLQNSAGLLVDQTGDTLDTTSASKTADGRLGDALDVVAKNFAVTLGASLAESLASFAASRHFQKMRAYDVLQRTKNECLTQRLTGRLYSGDQVDRPG